MAQAALLGTGPLAGLFGSVFKSAAPILNVGGGFKGLIGYSTGTANTGGQRGEARGIVHGQEAVIPLPSGGRIPVQLQGVGAGAAAATRVKVDVGVTVDENGNLQAFVRDVAQKATSDGIGVYDRGRKARLAADIPDLRRRGAIG